MIYLHLNKRTKILPLANSHIAHLCNKFNMFALQFLCHILKALFFYQNSPKIMLFLQKNAKHPETAPSRISGYAPVSLSSYKDLNTIAPPLN